MLGWHYNNKRKATTDLIHLNQKKHICKKSPLPLPTAHAFANFAHTSSGHAAVQEDFSGCERSGSYNNSNMEEEYDDIDNNQLFFRAVTKDSTSSHLSETRIQPLKLGDDATLDDDNDIREAKRRGGRTGAMAMINFIDGQFGMEQTCVEVIGLMRKGQVKHQCGVDNKNDNGGGGIWTVRVKDDKEEEMVHIQCL